jgi:hypothetical protein
MKKLLLSLILMICIISSYAQYYKDYNTYPIQSQSPYHNVIINPNQNRVKTNILPSLIGAILGAVVVNSAINNQYDYGNSRQIMRQHYYQNQLELQRIELLQRQVEILERQHYRRERGFLGFPKRRHRY